MPLYTRNLIRNYIIYDNITKIRIVIVSLWETIIVFIILFFYLSLNLQ